MTKKELLVVKKAYNCLKRGKLSLQTGLCYFVAEMYLSKKLKECEYYLFIKWLYRNKPKYSGSPWFWDIGERTVRLRFLKKELDKKLKKN